MKLVLRRIALFSLLLTPVWSFPVAASGATYYVSPTGSDSNNGTLPTTAWRTFAHVRGDQVPAGATILAQAGGVWTETIQVQTDHLHFGVFGSGAKPKIIAPDGQYAFDGNYRPGPQIDGYEFTATTRRGGEWGIVLVAFGDYVVRNTVVHGADGWMFMVRGPRGLVENCEFYDSGGSGETSSVSVGGYDGNGVPPAADVVAFRNNYVHDMAYRAIGTWGTNVLVQSNRVERWSAPSAVGSVSQAPAAIYVASRFAGNVTVSHNTVTGAGQEFQAIWVDTGPQQQTIVEANMVANARQCFWAEKTDNVVFRGNTCKDIRQSAINWGDGSGGADTYAPALNGLITGNTLIGATPAAGWILIYPGSTAAIVDQMLGPGSPPTVNTVSPTADTVVGGIFCTLSGSHFAAGATITVGGVAGTDVTVSGDAQVRFRVPAHAAGMVDIVLTNPDGQQVTLSQGFTYTAVSTVAPPRLPAGSPTAGTVMPVPSARASAPRSSQVATSIPAPAPPRR